jgi:L-ascorbate metabolism protein UlaG (beta-lactamase superfamily)
MVARFTRLALVALGFAAFAGAPNPAAAQCAPVARAPLPYPAPAITLASTEPEQKPEAGDAVPPGHVRITFLGHASFMIRSHQGVVAVTDYNDGVGAPVLPTIVTMNNAHITHYTDRPDPAIKHILRGWKDGGMAEHNVFERDVRVRNVPTNVRDWGSDGVRVAGNSIFVFEVAGMCIAHLGHLHHTLSPLHLKELGQIDVVMAPVDGVYTVGQRRIAEVIGQLKPRLVIPMHYWHLDALDAFLAMIEDRYPSKRLDTRTVTLSRVGLPDRAAWVLQGH